MSNKPMRASHIITFIDPGLKSRPMISNILARVVYNYGKEIGALYKNQFIFQLNVFDSNYHVVSEIIDKSLRMRINFNFRPKSCNADAKSDKCYNMTQFKVCANAVQYSDNPLSLVIIRSSLLCMINQQYNYLISDDDEDKSFVMSSEEIRCYERALHLIKLSNNAEIPVFVYVYDDPMLSYTISNRLDLIGIETALKNVSIELTNLYDKKSS